MCQFASLHVRIVAYFVSPFKRELRVGDLRIYYDVEEDPNFKVIVLAVGVKVRDRLCIGGEEIQL